jgi:drug/metabolite transporter (DMT)-like permease
LDASFRLKQVLAFAAVYLIWGSTFLAIKLAIETLPGFTMSAFRVGTVGLVLTLWGLARSGVRPSWRQIGWAALIGALLFGGGNGAVVWAQHHVASGAVALLVATEPLWVAILLALFARSEKPHWLGSVGVVLGFSGAALLALSKGADGAALHLPSVLAVLAGSLSWAAGSLLGRSAALPKSLRLASGLQMLAGSCCLALMGLARGEWGALDLERVTLRSGLALGYLLVFGSFVGFLAYNWLVRSTDPTLVSTYAFVNPMVAVLLGWLFAGEGVSPRTLIAAALIILSVVLVTYATVPRRKAALEVEGHG